MDLVERLPDFYRKEDISSNQDASALSAVVCVPLFSSSVVNSNPNLDVGASAVFGFLNPSVSFSERSENPLIPQILQSESLHGKRSSGLQRSRRGCSDQSQTVREIDSHKCWRAGLRRGRGYREGGSIRTCALSAFVIEKANLDLLPAQVFKYLCNDAGRHI